MKLTLVRKVVAVLLTIYLGLFVGIAIGFLNQGAIAKALHSVAELLKPTTPDSFWAAGVDYESGTEVISAEKISDGYTLLVVAYRNEAQLIDPRGKVIHRWHGAYSDFFPNGRGLSDGGSDDIIKWAVVEAASDGSLYVIFQSDVGSPNTLGMAKLDRESLPFGQMTVISTMPSLSARTAESIP